MRPRDALLAAVVLAASVTACGSGTPTADHGVGSPIRVETDEYLPGVEADLYLPGGRGTVPVVVMVPGGAWRTADRSGLAPLAERLAGAGMVVVNATHRAAGTGARFPGEIQDVTCSIDFAVARAAATGLKPGPVVVLGHSSGAHLAALAALGGEHFRGVCPSPATVADAFVGLSGIYDVTAVPDVAEPLFGVALEDDPARWRDGNAFTWVRERPSLPVFLAHGDRDELVPTWFTTSFAAALQETGHQVHVEIVTGAGHHDTYDPGVIGAQLVAWIRSLPGAHARLATSEAVTSSENEK